MVPSPYQDLRDGTGELQLLASRGGLEEDDRYLLSLSLPLDATVHGCREQDAAAVEVADADLLLHLGAWSASVRTASGKNGAVQTGDDAESSLMCSGANNAESEVSFNRFTRVDVPEERTCNSGRVSVLEAALKGFADRKTEVVVNPTPGTTFDSLAEAYDFYNLFSLVCER